MSDSAKALILTFFCGLTGCKFGDTPEGMFPIGNEGQMVAGNSDALRDFVVNGGSSTWVQPCSRAQVVMRWMNSDALPATTMRPGATPCSAASAARRAV